MAEDSHHKNHMQLIINQFCVNVAMFTGSSPEGIAVDPYSRLIFYADNGPDHIRVGSNFFGTLLKT